ncbi:hypothetical protein [Bacillus sp. MUM 13]|uniref:hypothetical protein n=1 Tax=Bacillus sp. MUM 13 TaxID=1678001 RepID=UPI0008F562F8|nr:hypothetical protein [Bacillus sp. MUM 13]OIK06811.1 hypothetical protein BIV59_21315 [Bacillus sp. MUM 13]
MFKYKFGPINVQVTFDKSVQLLEEELTEYYSHVASQTHKSEHHCHIKEWNLGSYKSLEEDEILWRGTSVEVNTKRNIKIIGEWDKDLNSIVSVSEGSEHKTINDRKRYWEFSQRVSIYPKLVKENCFMVHCAAIIVDGKANLFMGPSGAGKSTIAEKALSSGYKLLTDDTAIVQVVGDTLYAYSSPYKSKSGLIGDTSCYIVNNFYILSQSEQEKVVELTKGDFLKCLQERIYDSEYTSHLFPYKSKSLGGEVGMELMKHAYRTAKIFKAFEYKFTKESDLKDLFEKITLT